MFRGNVSGEEVVDAGMWVGGAAEMGDGRKLGCGLTWMLRQRLGACRVASVVGCLGACDVGSESQIIAKHGRSTKIYLGSQAFVSWMPAVLESWKSLALRSSRGNSGC